MDDRQTLELGCSAREEQLELKWMTLIWERKLVSLAVLSDLADNRTGTPPPQSRPQAASNLVCVQAQ
jgi:hypothetical protein